MVKLDDKLKDSLVSKLDEYQGIVQTSVSVCKGRDAYRDDHSIEIQSLREPFLYALTILEGDKDKYQFCFETALQRSVYRSGSTCGTQYNTINYNKLRAEIVTLALLLEQRDMEDYLHELNGGFVK